MVLWHLDAGGYTKGSMRASSNPQSIAEIMRLTDVPVVCIDAHGMFTFVNDMFEQTFGWNWADLRDKPVTTIMPPEFRDAHQIGFSRFLATEQATLIGKSLPLAMLHKDGRVADAVHYILGEKKNGAWRFAATIIDTGT